MVSEDIWTSLLWTFASMSCGQIAASDPQVSKFSHMLGLVQRPFKGRAKSRVVKSRVLGTYTTGKTLGKTTLASAKYSYRIRWSNSSVVYFTNVACHKGKD